MRALVGLLDEWLANGKFPALIIVIVTGLMLWAFLFTNDYRIESIAVEGLQYGDGSLVVEEAALLERSAFRARPAAVADRVAGLPFVERVSIDLRFPGEARITIVERTPVLNVAGDSDDVVVSRDAFTVARGQVAGLPTLRLDSRGASLEEALTSDVILAARSIAGRYGPDATMIWNPDIGLVMEMPGGDLVNFGAPDNIEAKLAVLAAIETQLEDGWSELDLSVPTRPSYR